MGPPKKIQFQDREVTGYSVDFQNSGEPWAVYNLEDGTVVKVKTILLDVVRLEEYNNQTGEPIYQFSAQQVIAVQVPEELKKKKD